MTILLCEGQTSARVSNRSISSSGVPRPVDRGDDVAGDPDVASQRAHERSAPGGHRYEPSDWFPALRDDDGVSGFCDVVQYFETPGLELCRTDGLPSHALT